MPSTTLESGWDVGLFEILPLEEEWLAGDLGEGIGEAVTEIQPGYVAALTEVEEGLACEMRLLDGERFDNDAGSAEKNIALTASVGPDLASITMESSTKFAALIRQRLAPWMIRV
jgi:hypothetical protein